jgi:hypothetical protein
MKTGVLVPIGLVVLSREQSQDAANIGTYRVRAGQRRTHGGARRYPSGGGGNTISTPLSGGKHGENASYAPLRGDFP